MPRPTPNRGEVWEVGLDPVQGREQGRRRPAVVLSVDSFNRSRADLFIAVPMTTRRRNVPLHVEVTPPDGGLREVGFAMCENIRSLSRGRLVAPWGYLSAEKTLGIAKIVRVLLGLGQA